LAELYRYAAFISYSSKDAAFARRLHRALENYNIPSSLGRFDPIGRGKRNRIYPVFRDREELSAGQLGDQIEANLRAAAALIVVCSPSSAASPWVQKEIEYFAAHGRQDRIFAIVADTAPLVDETGADATQSCFPPAFRGNALAGDKLEPLAADARNTKDGFRSAWLKVVAGIIGVTPGQIIDRDRVRRRNRTVRSALILVLTVVGIASAFFTQTTWVPIVTSAVVYRPYTYKTEMLALAPNGSSFQDCRHGSADCPTMIIVPEGRFFMGSPSDAVIDSFDELPRRRLVVARFAASRHEITRANWRACVNAGAFSDEILLRSNDEQPVTHVSWEDAQAYVHWLSRMTGAHYRLLNEAEWEYLARDGKDDETAIYSWGSSQPICDRGAPNGATFADCQAQTVSNVGGHVASEFGFFDLHGNAAEWVQDCYAPYDPLLSNVVVAEHDHNTSSCSSRVVRGGSWRSRASELASANRSRASAITREDGVGFRVARTISSSLSAPRDVDLSQDDGAESFTGTPESPENEALREWCESTGGTIHGQGTQLACIPN
jgi:formylglycine-generating enzyme required for sulfatase activity